MSVVSLMLMMACRALAYEGIITPLYVGNLDPILDERGQPMHGSNQGCGHGTRCRVELRVMLDGQIYAPSTDGEAHANNPLLSPDAVGGIGQNASESHSGIFCMIFPTRLPAGLQFFARVYNARTVENASFYVDSAVATVPLFGSSLPLTFGDPQPIDTRDIDGDGLINSWERSLGTDSRFTSDFDGDGISDLDEMRAGTDPTEAPPPQPIFSSIRREMAPISRTAADGLSQSIRVSFQSVPGRTYDVQYMSSPLVGQQEFTTVGTRTADADQCEMLVEVPAEDSFIILRLITK